MTVFYEALQEQDVNKLVYALDRDFTASASAGMPLGVCGVHEGASACVSDLWAVVHQSYDVAPMPSEMWSGPDGAVVVHGWYNGTIRRTHTPMRAEFVHLLRLEQRFAGRTAPDHGHRCVGRALMGRAAQFSEDQILAAATRHVAHDGPRASVAALARLLNAPSGSIYYRFANRDRLVAEVWLRAVRDFQRGFLAALDQPELDDAAFAAATHVPRWCAASLDQAIVLHRYRLDDLVDVWPVLLVPDRAALNKDLGAALRRHARLRYGSATGAALERTTFALVNLPGGSVRRVPRSPPAAAGVGDRSDRRRQPGRPVRTTSRSPAPSITEEGHRSMTTTAPAPRSGRPASRSRDA